MTCSDDFPSPTGNVATLSLAGHSGQLVRDDTTGACSAQCQTAAIGCTLRFATNPTRYDPVVYRCVNGVLTSQSCNYCSGHPEGVSGSCSTTVGCCGGPGQPCCAGRCNDISFGTCVGGYCAPSFCN